MTLIKVNAPSWLHRHLIGPKGSLIKPIQEAYPSVLMNFTDNDSVEVEGQSADAAAVAAKLNESVKELVIRFCPLGDLHSSLAESPLLK